MRIRVIVEAEGKEYRLNDDDHASLDVHLPVPRGTSARTVLGLIQQDLDTRIKASRWRAP